MCKHKQKYLLLYLIKSNFTTLHTQMLLFLDIGGGEMLLIILVGLLIFGGDKLPEIIRNISRGASYIKNASEQVKEQINQETGISDAINDIKKDIDDTVTKTSEGFDPTWETVIPQEPKKTDKEAQEDEKNDNNTPITPEEKNVG